MKLSSGALLVLLALVVGLGLFLFGEGESETRAVETKAQAEVADAMHTDAELASPVDTDSELDTESASIPARMEAPVAARITEPGTQWIEGRVVFPEGTPADEVATVVARGKAFKQSGSHVDRVAVGLDGRFRIAFADGTKRGSLKLEAKYLYLERNVSVKPASQSGEVLLEPELGGCVEVSLVSSNDVADEDIRNAEVLLLQSTPGGRFSGDTRARLEGRLARFSAIRPAPECMVTFRAPKFIARMDYDVNVRAGEVTRLEFDLELGARLVGHVVDEAGKPVAGATVTIRQSGGIESNGTSGSGKFKNQGLTPGALSIQASHNGYTDSEELSLNVMSGETIDGIELVLKRGLEFSGVVTWPDGKTVSEAQVFCEQSEIDRARNAPNSTSNTTTAEDGTFRLTGLLEEQYRLRAIAKPDLPRLDGENAVEFKRRMRRVPFGRSEAIELSPTQHGLRLVLQVGALVRGFVVDDLGNPLKKFRVFAVPPSDAPQNASSMERVTISEKRSKDGSFILGGLGDGEFEIYATAKGHAARERQTIAVPGNHENVQIVLPREASVAGIVIDERGNPIAGARVEQDSVKESGFLEVFSFAPPENETTSDAEGRYRIGSLAPGGIKLRAVATGFADGDWFSLQVNPGDEIVEIELQVQRGGSVMGKIHRSVGEVEKIGVTLNQLSGGRSKYAESDSNGRFRFDDLTAGEYLVALQPDMSDFDPNDATAWLAKQARQIRATVEVRNGETAEVTLGLPSASSVTVSGRITSNGQGAAGQSVHAISLDQAMVGVSATTKSDDNGGYSLTVSEPGRYRISVGSGWGNFVASKDVTLSSGGTDVDLEIPGASLVGTVSGPEGHLPGINLTLEKLSSSGDPRVMENRTARTDEDGNYSFTSLSPGSYLLRAAELQYWMNDPADGVFGRALISGIVIDEDPKAKRVDVELRPAAILTGVVLDLSGSPVAGVSVGVHNAANFFFTSDGAAQTNSLGHFTIRGLPAEKLKVIVLEGELFASEEVRLYEGETAEVELTLK